MVMHTAMKTKMIANIFLYVNGLATKPRFHRSSPLCKGLQAMSIWVNIRQTPILIYMTGVWVLVASKKAWGSTNMFYSFLFMQNVLKTYSGT